MNQSMQYFDVGVLSYPCVKLIVSLFAKVCFKWCLWTYSRIIHDPLCAIHRRRGHWWPGHLIKYLFRNNHACMSHMLYHRNWAHGLSFVVVCFGLVATDLTHILQGYFTGAARKTLDSLTHKRISRLTKPSHHHILLCCILNLSVHSNNTL